MIRSVVAALTAPRLAVILAAGLLLGGAGSATAVPADPWTGQWLGLDSGPNQRLTTFSQGGAAITGSTPGSGSCSTEPIVTFSGTASADATTADFTYSAAPGCPGHAGTFQARMRPDGLAADFTGVSQFGTPFQGTITYKGGGTEPRTPPPSPAVGAPPPTTPAQIVPRTTRPVPGVVTSYAAPRPGKVAALPFPAGGCAPPAASAARESATSTHEECHVDIFLRRKGGKLIEDPDAVFAGLVVSEENQVKAFNLCQFILLGHLAELSDDDFSRFTVGQVATCLVAVSRILQRAEDLKRARRRPLELVSHAAHRCRVRAVRVLGGRRGRPSPVTTLCRDTAASTRMTFRSARKGQAIGSLVQSSSKLIVGRSHAVRFRPGDRIDVLWTITPPPTTTTIRMPAPIA